MIWRISVHFVVISRLSLRFMENSKQDKRLKRQSNVPSFETDPETHVEKKYLLRAQEQLFFLSMKNRVLRQHLTTLNAWPRGYSDEAKLALRPGQYEFISHNSVAERMMNLGRASIERAREHNKLTSEVYAKEQRPPYMRRARDWKRHHFYQSDNSQSNPTSQRNCTTDMRFSPEPLNETPSRNTGEQLTVHSKKVAKKSSQMKATTQPLLFQESATTSTAKASVQVILFGLKKAFGFVAFWLEFF